jgi:hypothetical protein
MIDILLHLLIFAFGLLCGAGLILLTQEPKGITKHNREPKRYVYNDQHLNRKYRDAAGRREVRTGRDGVNYQWINIAGEEE